MFWIGILYFAEGFPLGIFYELFPVYFRQQNIALSDIGLLSLLGLSWTFKFIWAPAIDYFRHHRRWMFSVDIAMGLVMLLFAFQAGFAPWLLYAIGLFTLLSATNDIAIDGYTIEMLNKNELGLANGLRIGFYRVGMLASGFILVLSDYLDWTGAYLCAAAVLFLTAFVCLKAPKEKDISVDKSISVLQELLTLLRNPLYFLLAILFLSGLILGALKFTYSAAILLSSAFVILIGAKVFLQKNEDTRFEKGPMFGALLEILRRPYILPVILFVLIFKLADSSMGFMVKPFWVDAGFSASEIGLVSVNLGIGLSIAGGIAGGWYTDRVGIFRGLWVLGLLQAFSNLGYAFAAHVIPITETVVAIPMTHTVIIYSASAIESFTGGLGTAAFLAFLMAIVNKQHSATEYALLSSLFALSRSVAGWAGGYGAETMGYSDYFLLTFFLAFPAYLLLHWVNKMLKYASTNKDWAQN